MAASHPHQSPRSRATAKLTAVFSAGSVHAIYHTAVRTLCGTEPFDGAAVVVNDARAVDCPDCRVALARLREERFDVPSQLLGDDEEPELERRELRAPVRRPRVANRELLLEVLEAAGRGLEDDAIARELGLSREGVRSRWAAIRSELGARNRVHAYALAWRGGWLEQRRRAA